MASLQVILDRLETQGLHGPASPYATQPQNGENSNGSWEEDAEVDVSTWYDLFAEYFVDKSDSRNDDLLFFVRKLNEKDEVIDPVFVKRKQPPPNMMPVIDDIVLWRETFFLNLIVQLPCKLTVAVCKRVEPTGPGQRTSMTCSRKHVSKRVYALPTKSRMDVKESYVECSYPHIYYVIDDYEDMFEQLVVMEGEYLCVELAVTMPNDLEQAKRSLGGSDNVSAGDNIDDVVGEEDDDVSDIENYDTMVTPRGTFRNNAPSPSRIDTALSPAMDIYTKNYPYNTPFPQPSLGDTKITLFQGAVSYAAILDVYKQKTGPNSKINRRFKAGREVPPTEYVMMRGPGGKGHAQVAITAAARDSDVFSLAGPSSAPPHPVSTASSRPSSRSVSRAPSLPPSTTSSAQASPMLSPVLSTSRSLMPEYLAGQDDEKPKTPSRSSSTGSFFQTFKRLSLGEGGKSAMAAGAAVTGVNVQNPEALKCCMTFVNVPWTSIVSDLMMHSRKKPIP